MGGICPAYPYLRHYLEIWCLKILLFSCSQTRISNICGFFFPYQLYQLRSISYGTYADGLKISPIYKTYNNYPTKFQLKSIDILSLKCDTGIKIRWTECLNHFLSETSKWLSFYGLLKLCSSRYIIVNENKLYKLYWFKSFYEEGRFTQKRLRNKKK